MRTVVTTLLSALAGALIALGIAHSSGWSGHTTRIVAVPESPSAGTPALVRSSSPLLGNGFDPSAIYTARSAGVVTLYADFNSGDEAQGSGFVVTRSGLILTSSHVITNAGNVPRGTAPTAAGKVYVEFSDRDRVPARIVGWDVFDDIGLLRVEPRAHALRPVPLGRSASVRVGEPVAVIGSPFGNQNSLDAGVVSGVHRSIDSLTSAFRLADAIQLDAPITHGNSGGPVFDAAGRVIGIAAQIRTDTGQAEGVGFAVPIDSARRSLLQLVTKGKVAYAFVGVRTVDLTPTIAHELKLGARRGAIVVAVEEGSAAAEAKLQAGLQQVAISGVSFRTGGDVILAIDGRAIQNGDDLARLVTDRFRPGQTATLTILRAGRRLHVPIRLGTRHD